MVFPFNCEFLPVLSSIMLQVVLISLSLQDHFKKNKWYAKSVDCHQFNLMKDKLNIILILVRSILNSSSGVAHDVNSFLKCSYLFFFSRVPSSFKYLFVRLLLNLGKVIILYPSTFVSFNRSLVYGGPSWWFIKVSIRSQVFFKIRIGEPQVSFSLAFLRAIVLPLSFEVVL